MSNITTDDPASIAALNPHKSAAHLEIVRAQIEERVQLVRAWAIQPGEHVLEVGCGQGECSAVLAAAVGAHGSVTGLDPASPEYGSPYTLGEAQAHLRASPLGPRLTFVRADAPAFLARTDGAPRATYSAAVLAQCTWYFPTPAALTDTLRALAARAARVCVAEWAMRASAPHAAGVPHVLAAAAQAALECRKPASVSNVRTVLAPAALRAAAAAAGLRLLREEYIVPAAGMRDGSWETGAVLGDGFAAEIEAHVRDEREKAVVYALRDGVRAAVDLVGEGRLRAMDVWVATFVKE